MIYQKSSKHSPQEVEQSLRAAAQRHKFGVLHVLDLKNTLHDKGIDLDNEVRIYDVCNPLAASQALHQDLATATVLPCRIAVYSNAGASTIATVKPTDLFAATGLGQRILWRGTSNENFSLSSTKRQREKVRTTVRRVCFEEGSSSWRTVGLASRRQRRLLLSK